MAEVVDGGDKIGPPPRKVRVRLWIALALLQPLSCGLGGGMCLALSLPLWDGIKHEWDPMTDEQGRAMRLIFSACGLVFIALAVLMCRGLLQWRWLVAFGDIVEGKVTSKYKEKLGRHVKYTHIGADQIERKGSGGVGYRVWERLEEGGPITVLVNPAKPKLHEAWASLAFFFRLEPPGPIL